MEDIIEKTKTNIVRNLGRLPQCLHLKEIKYPFKEYCFSQVGQTGFEKRRVRGNTSAR